MKRMIQRGWLAASVLLAICALLPLSGSSCAGDPAPLLPARLLDPPDTGSLRLVARIAHVSDTQIVDSQSPARFTGTYTIVPSAWRAWENCSTQLMDGIIRSVNRIHAAGSRIDLLVHTGDVTDNVQTNELAWFMTVMEGGTVWPLSGPDDRPLDARPEPTLDPYAPFDAQGLYRVGVHGDAPSIPWYVLFGNHDTHCIGTFPIIDGDGGSRVAPLPLAGRPGLLLPTILDPTASWAYSALSPADPGPPRLLNWPASVVANADRRFFTREEFVSAMFGTQTAPDGHGFASPGGRRWYSVSPVPGLRLIALDTSDEPGPVAGMPYAEGCISQWQLEFLQNELDAAVVRGERVIVATHHPSNSLEVLYGSSVGPEEFRALLNACPNVVVHLAGHRHINRVVERGGYVEIETCSTMDAPQEARILELWEDETDGSTVVSYRTFSELGDEVPALGADPLRPLRLEARALAARGRTGGADRPVDDADPAGGPGDRAGTIRLPR